ncbi:MAG: hypothetical protein KIT73_10615, partial [Burkholderiales bacterium]|nr:hypothetical protein [Burkholderiales bacterium]
MPERSRHPFRLIADTKVGTRLLILVLGFLIWGAVGSLLAFQTLREVQVNGPIYARLVEGKDLIADILPPPRYIVEANLLAHELFLADAAEDKSDLEQRLRSLAQDYARRQSFWEQAGLEAPLHQALVVKSHEPANLFFKVAFDAFLP